MACTWEIIVQVTLQFLRTCKSMYCYIDICKFNICGSALCNNSFGGGGRAVAIHFSFTAVEVFSICPPYYSRPPKYRGLLRFELSPFELSPGKRPLPIQPRPFLTWNLKHILTGHSRGCAARCARCMISNVHCAIPTFPPFTAVSSQTKEL